MARLKGSSTVTFCATVLQNVPANQSINADILYGPLSIGCNNPQCTGNYNYDPF